MHTLEPSLKKHLINEFTKGGIRAVSFFENAELIANNDMPLEVTKQGEIIAYCIREGLMSLLEIKRDIRSGQWKLLSEKVTEAYVAYKAGKYRLDDNKDVSIVALERSLDELTKFKTNGGVNTEKLLGILLYRTGTNPINSKIVQQFTDLLEDCNNALHGQIDFDQGKDLWNRCVYILKLLFMPSENRILSLDQLAIKRQPNLDDLRSLEELVSSASHLTYFLQKIESFSWVELISQSHLFMPPSDSDFWPTLIAFERYASSNGSQLIKILTKLIDQSQPRKHIPFFLKSAIALLPLSAELVYELAKNNLKDPTVLWLVTTAIENVPSESEIVEQLSDILLTAELKNETFYSKPVLDKFIDGVNQENAESRIKIIGFKLRHLLPDSSVYLSLKFDRLDSLSRNVDFYHYENAAAFLQCLLRIMEKCSQWIDYEQLPKLIELLPEDIQARLRVWYLVNSPTFTKSHTLFEILSGINTRKPNGDDFNLVSRLIKEMPLEIIQTELEVILNETMVETKDLDGKILNELPDQVVRTAEWLNLFPVKYDSNWTRIITFANENNYFLDVEKYNKRTRALFSVGQSPVTLEELRSKTVSEICAYLNSWSPNPTDFMVSSTELARTFQQLVASEPHRWFENCLEIGSTLTRPIYVQHYLMAAIDLIKSKDFIDIKSLAEFIKSLMSKPAVEDSIDNYGSDNFEMDWSSTKFICIELIGALLDNDNEMGGLEDYFWTLIRAAAIDASQPSHISGENIGPRELAINRSCTKATEVLLSSIRYEHEVKNVIRLESFELLSELLRIPGNDGLQYRSIIVPWCSYLRKVNPIWFDQNVDLIFGREAPDELGPQTIRLALSITNASSWFLLRFRKEIISAITQNQPNALTHFLIGMLWNLAGYDVESCFVTFQNLGLTHLETGEILGRLLRGNDVEISHIEIGIEFWKRMIQQKQIEGLISFGWMSEVKKLDSDEWLELTLETLEITNGKIDWSNGIANRILDLDSSSSIFEILNKLVRAQNGGWQLSTVIDVANRVILRSPQFQDDPAFQRLYTALAERRAF